MMWWINVILVMGCNLFFGICNGYGWGYYSLVMVVMGVMGHLYTSTHEKSKSLTWERKMERLPITPITFKLSKGLNPLHNPLHTHYNPLQIGQVFP